MRIISFSIDNQALFDFDCHSKRWHAALSPYVEHIDVLVEVREGVKLNEKYIAPNVRIIPLQISNPIMYPYRALTRALKEHHTKKYDIAITEDPFRPGIAGFWFKKKTQVPLSVEYHTETFFNKQWFWERPFRHFFYTHIGKKVVRNADSIRCVNMKHKAQLSNLTNHSTNTLIESIPCPTGAFSFDDKSIAQSIKLRKQFLKDEKDVLFLFVGRLEPVKKVDELIRTYLEIIKEFNNTSLLIVGDGSLSNSLKKMVPLKDQHRIHFIGYVKEEEIFDYYGACDVFVNPAHFESYGRVFLEAMSAAKPIITTSKVGAVEDGLCINGVNSFLYEAGDLNQLKSLMITLLKDNKLRLQLGNNALIKFQEKNQYNVVVEKMIHFWNQTITLGTTK